MINANYHFNDSRQILSFRHILSETIKLAFGYTFQFHENGTELNVLLWRTHSIDDLIRYCDVVNQIIDYHDIRCYCTDINFQLS